MLVLPKALLDGGDVHSDCVTVTDGTVSENLKDVSCPKRQEVARPTSAALWLIGGPIVLDGTPR